MAQARARNKTGVLYSAFAMGLCAATVLGAWGCQRENAPGTRETSGSRLKRRYYRAPGGAELLVGYYDVELETPCELARAGDGAFRCLPVRPYLERSTPGASIAIPTAIYFADASCEVPVRGFEAGCEPPPYYKSSEIVGCDNHYTVFRVGEEVAREDLYMKEFGTGDCVPESGATMGDQRYHVVQEEVPPRTFVKLEREGVFGSQRLGRQVYAGSDGARIHGEVLDLQLDVACRVWRTLDETPRCVPSKTASLGYYSSPNCDTPLANHSQGAECVEDHVFDYEERDGFPYAVIFELGAQVEPEVVYSSVGGVCEESALFQGIAFWEVGPEVTQETFVALSEHRGGSEGRIQTFGLSTPDGFELPRREFWDSGREERCRPQTTADGVVRCVPYLNPIREAFRDDACTQLSPVALITSSFFNTEGETHYGGRFGETCPETVEVFQLTETAAATPLYEEIAGECRELQLFVPMGAKGYVEVGDAVPAEDFEPLEQVTE